MLRGILCLAAFACATPASAQTVVTAAPYLWAPTVSGTVALGPLSLPVEVGPADLASGVRVGAMGSLTVEHGPITIMADVIGVSFQRDAFAPTLGQDLAVQVASVELVGGYRLPTRRHLSVTPLMGLRYNNLDVAFGTAPAAIRVQAEWLEPVIGLAAAATPTGRLTLNARALVGRRDGRRHSVDLALDLDRRLSSRISLFAGYRYVRQNYEGRGAAPFGIDLEGHGPLLGVRGRFWALSGFSESR